MNKLFSIAFFKSLYFNLHFFGWRGLKMPVILHRRVKLLDLKGSVSISNFSTGSVTIGFGGTKGIQENRNSYFSVSKGARIVFEGKAGISAGNTIRVDKGVLTIGANFSSNKNCFIACSNGVTIGKDVTLGWDVHIRDNDGHKIVSSKIKETDLAVRIGNHVWLCSYVDVLKGVNIPDESVVAYRALVTKPFEGEGLLIGGCPAKVLQEDIRWEY